MKDVINILSIDGGGIRGILPAEILVYVEKRLSEICGKDTRLSEYFDFISGTSTGGILAALYCFPDENGKSKYSTIDASNLYMENGHEIFKKCLRWYLTLGGLLGPRYNPDRLESIIRKYFGDVKIKESVVNFMSPSVDTNNRDICFFKSYKDEEFETGNMLFSQAVRSTSAAPTYFRPNKIIMSGYEMSLIDGGMGVNNPTISAYIDVIKLYPNAKKINILSIGTAPSEISYSYKKSKNWGIIFGSSKLFDINMNSMSDVVDYQLNELYRNNNMVGEYLRIQPNLFGASSEMDNVSKENLKKLKDAGIKSVEIYKDKIDRFLDIISKPV